MKHSALFLFASLLNTAVVNVASAKQIDFKIQGINDSEGNIYIQLFKGEDNFKQGKAEEGRVLTPKSEEEVISFTNVEAGTYAVRLFHDENSNGELDTNLFGLPTEGYAFSNNAKPNFGPVPFKAMQFVVTEDDDLVTNTTTIIY